MKIIMIDGGAGRVLTSIPALLKYDQLNLNKEEWYISVPWWDLLLWGIPELHPRVLNPENPNVFEDYFWRAEEVITLEPYRVPEYYRQEISLAESFDLLLNGRENKDIPLPSLKIELSTMEMAKGMSIINDVKSKQGKEKTIVIQPYGSTAEDSALGIIDGSLRSIPERIFNKYVDNLKEDYNVIYMGVENLHRGDSYFPSPTTNIREWSCVIALADYFIGCDSVGQHFAKVFDKKASVFMGGGTHEKNVSYPDEFHIIKKACFLKLNHISSILHKY